MQTLKTHRFDRTASEVAATVVLVLMFATASVLATEPVSPDTSSESTNQQDDLVVGVGPESIGSEATGVPLAEAIELHRRVELGIATPEISGLDPRMVADAIERHFRIEHGLESPSQVGSDTAWLAEAIELHVKAESKS
jgi:hypothetical protein